MTKVFISSTAEDLSEYRTAAVSVCNELGYVPIAMQFFGPIDNGATAGSKEKLKDATLYVGIFAHRYGYIEEGYNCSVTEAEFDYAHERGIERFCFLVDPKFSWPPAFWDHDNYARLKAFKQRIDRTLIRGMFTTVDNFQGQLSRALAKWMVQRVATGFYALRELMEDSRINEAVVRFRFVLAETSKQFQALARNKLIHDALHDLQYSFYDTVSLSRGLPLDELGLDSLGQYEFNYLTILEKLQNVFEVSNEGEPFWMSFLEKGERCLLKAIKSKDPTSRDEATEAVKLVLEVAPPLINQRLKDLTRTSGLRTVIAALASVADRLGDPALDHDKVSKFQTGVSELQELSRRLETMVERHDRWQRLDSLLRVLHSTIGSSPHDLNACWKEICDLAGALQTIGTERLKRFAEAQAALGRTLETGSAEAIDHCFNSFRTRAGMLFLSADQELKELCDEMLKVGEPLAFILEAVFKG